MSDVSENKVKVTIPPDGNRFPWQGADYGPGDSFEMDARYAHNYVRTGAVVIEEPKDEAKKPKKAESAT